MIVLDPQLVIDETESEQPAARGLCADEGRKVLRGILDEIVARALSWHEAWKDQDPEDGILRDSFRVQ